MSDLRTWRLSQTPPVTQHALSRATGIHRTRVSKLETGAAVATLDEARRLFDATNGAIDANALAGIRREPQPATGHAPTT